MKQFPPYEGNEPYLFFAFAEQDSGKVWKQMRPLLARGCRIWYSSGPAGSASEVLRRRREQDDIRIFERLFARISHLDVIA